MRKKVLILTGYYWPSIKGGGPIQSIKNIVDNFSDEMEFYIITADRDFGDDEPFSNIVKDSWSKVGNANVLYTDMSDFTLYKMLKIIRNSGCQTLYLNSFFSPKFTVLPLILAKLNLIKFNRIIVAPRGEFSPGAYKIKRQKKNIYLRLFKAFRLNKDIVWHATAQSEKDYISKKMVKEKKIVVANNLTANYSNLQFNKDIKKITGEVNLVFISRIHPKKNLNYALQLLTRMREKVTLNIYGPIEDEQYWMECEKIIKKMPSNITVNYHGLARREEIMNIFSNNHFFLFPTLGENYGHVISESLIGGCPVIISNETPWRNLESKNVGWDIPLEREELFDEVLSKVANMDEREYKNMATSAFNFGKKSSNNEEDKLSYRELFLF